LKLLYFLKLKFQPRIVPNEKMKPTKVYSFIGTSGLYVDFSTDVEQKHFNCKLYLLYTLYNIGLRDSRIWAHFMSLMSRNAGHNACRLARNNYNVGRRNFLCRNVWRVVLVSLKN
jgi:hypothetical protein